PGVYSTNNVLTDAEKAYSAGDYPRARALYQQVANTATDTNQKVYAMNKLATMPQAGYTPGQTASNSNETRTALSPSNLNPNLMKLKDAAWTQYGRLYETKLAGDAGQPLYAMDM